MIIRPNTRQLRAVGEHYTILPTRTARDMALSAKAAKLLMYMLSMPDKWQFRRTHLAGVFGVAPRQISRWTKELREQNYLEITKQNNGDNTWLYFYIVYSMRKDLALRAYLDNPRDENTVKVIQFPIDKAAGNETPR